MKKMRMLHTCSLNFVHLRVFFFWVAMCGALRATSEFILSSLARGAPLQPPSIIQTDKMRVGPSGASVRSSCTTAIPFYTLILHSSMYMHHLMCNVFTCGSLSSSRSGSTQHPVDHDRLHPHAALGSCRCCGDGVKGHWIFGRSRFPAKPWFISTIKDDSFCIGSFLWVAFSRLRCCLRDTATTTSALSWPTKPLRSSASPPTTTISFRSRPWVRAAKVWAVNPSTSIN